MSVCLMILQKNSTFLFLEVLKMEIMNDSNKNIKSWSRD